MGKKAVGLIVIDENGDGLSVREATVRTLSKFLSSILLYIGFIMIGFTKKKQGLHDKIAHTFVIIKDPDKKESGIDKAVKYLVLFAALIVILAIISAFVFGMAGSVQSEEKNIPPTTIAPQKTVSKCVATYTDDFTRWQSDWDKEFVWSDGRSVKYQNSALYIKDYPTEGGSYHTLNRNFKNFILNIDIEHISGSPENWEYVGVRETDSGSGYFFGISSDGYYIISKNVDSLTVPLVNPVYSSHINQGVGKKNNLQIKCSGNELNFSVNGYELTTISDNSYSQGKISLYAQAYSKGTQPTELRFDNLEVCVLP
jgi:hypothetical protein